MKGKIINSAIIVAGGTGSRINSSIPKQFISINGKEILNYSVETFFKHPKINEVVIVSNSKWINHVKDNYSNCKVVKGGDSRQKSVINGIIATSNETINVLIHDGARPFITNSIISKCLSVLKSAKGSAPIIELTESIIKHTNNNSTFLERESCRLVQTPQCFKKQFILNILKNNIQGTDEVGLALRLFPDQLLKFIPGDINNFKITHDIDLQLAKEFINSQHTHD